MAISICSNLSLLGFFKYFNFGAGSYDAIVDAIGGQGVYVLGLFRDRAEAEATLKDIEQFR